jgi:hypothetical protein
MKHRLSIVIFLVWLLGGCATSSAPLARVEWVGTYSASGAERVDAPWMGTGKFTHSFDPRLAEATTRIPARLGIHYGVSYRFDGSAPPKTVLVEVIWRFPKAVITPRDVDVRKSHESYQTECPVDTSCLVGRVVTERWETEPGPWVVEVWLAGTKTKVLEQRFELVGDL